MYEPLDPPLPRPARSESPGGPRPRPQAAQSRSPSTLDLLLEGLREPALAHRDGRIIGVNTDLTRLMAHPAPDRLIGLPADALLHRVHPGLTGRVHRASLTTPTGPRPVGLLTLRLALPEGSVMLWLFGPAPAETPRPHREALERIDALCEQLWQDAPPDRDALLTELAQVTALLDPPQELTHVVSSDLAALVRSLTGSHSVQVRRPVRTDVSPDELTHLLAPVLSALPPDSRIRVDVDVAAHPVVILRHEHARLVPSTEALRRLQVLAGNLRGSAISLEAGRVLRIRLPRPRPARCSVTDSVRRQGSPGA